MNTYFKSKPLILLLDIAILSSTALLFQSAQAASYGTALAPGPAGSGASQLAIVGAPPNDNFANATVISGLPFSDTVDISEATNELDEPYYCSANHSVWYSFTPTANATVLVDPTGSSFYDTSIAIYQAVGPGIAGLSYLKCANWSESAYFDGKAGMTYYIQVGTMGFTGGGPLQLSIREIPPPANDDFANATAITGIPFDDFVDTIGATTQTGEPVPYCADQVNKTVWYAFTPTANGSVTASIPSSPFVPILAVYTGTTLDNLNLLKCQWGNSVTIQAESGTTYYFQVTSWWYGGPMQFHLDVPPPPQVGFFYWPPYELSTFDMAQFVSFSYDPAQIGFQSYTWDFGDGTTSTDIYAYHQYSSDGDYTVKFSATTFDGRTASATQVIHVQTHDVAISRISAPLAASVGQTRPIVVSVRSTRYTETVHVDLYKAVPGKWDQLIGSLTQEVPVLQANRPTFFQFQYKFTNEDASAGKVTFYAVAKLESHRDVYPADNQIYSLPSTKVNKSK